MLARFAVWYGVDLHRRRRQEHMCNVFEALVGAVTEDRGIDSAVQWLVSLFHPWSVAFTPWDLSGQTVPEFDRPHMEWLEAKLPGYTGIDISSVNLPLNYPPPLPLSHSAVQPMYEDVFRDGRADWSLGQSLQQLAITFVCIDRVASSSTMELGTIRDGCASAELFGRLGLLYDVHRYMRHSYKAEGWYMGQSREGLCALMTYIFVHKGFETLMSWLRPLLSPWIDAIAQEKFTPNPKFMEPQRQKTREARARNGLKGTKKLKNRLTVEYKSSNAQITSVARTRYATTVPRPL
ncbi:hypothetical protein C8F01DRAFT_1248824 [Mycena amicta]|nr:hypothetical protein C8F01DRAFT_1248824 [Mycena amicta]